MKTNSNSKQQMGKPQIASPKRPQNKDDLDSREGEEQLFKGDDRTHNKKEVHNAPNRKKR
ncbi:MAG: hypothetical protein V4556_11890 [Bacteroidota bacterium]